MALYQPKDSSYWWVSVVNPRTRQRIRRSTKLTNKSHARLFEDQLMASMVLGQEHYALADRRLSYTWQQAADRWLDETATKKDHPNDVWKVEWLRPQLAKVELSNMTVALIQQVGARKAMQSSYATANRLLALISAVLNRAHKEWEWLDRVPHIRFYPESKQRIRYLTKAEAVRLVRELPPHLADQARFTLYTGLRAANVYKLRWQQIDLKRQHMWITADQAKAGKAIPVPLSPDALKLLSERVGQHSVYVFTYQGRPAGRQSNHAWQKAVKRAGLVDFRWHDLRHTWATWHIQSGTPLHVLQELGGWASYEMVRRYAHLSSGHLRQFAGNVGSV